MGAYLDKFNDTIGKRQTQQILKILNKKRNSGQIRTVKEFSQKFEELIRDLQGTVLSPSLKIFLAEEDNRTSSEGFNFMLDRVQDDLESAFEEAINIDEVQRSHEAITRDVSLKNLRAGIAELEAKISLYEFLNEDARGFDSAIFTTFKESKENRTERGGAFTSVLFTDPRTNELIRPVQDAEVELVGERLVLSNAKKTFHNIVDVRQLFDENNPQSELVVEPTGSNLTNIIDGIRGTYWIQSLLFKEKRESVKIQISFDLGNVKEINFIDIEPVSKYGLTLESISYVDGNQVVTNLGMPEQLVESEVSIRLRKFATKRIILTFRNDNIHRTQFEFNKKIRSLFDQTLSQPPEGITPTKEEATEDLRELISSDKVKNILGLKESPKEVFSGYEFIIGLDNIRFGFTESESKSIYVSSPLEICGAGQLGLKTVESRPYRSPAGGPVQFTKEVYDNDSNNEIVSGSTGRNFLCSTEYWIIKQDLDAEGLLVRTNIFPMLPLGVTRVHQERLVLSEKSDPNLVDNDIGTFMFFTNRATGNIKVYRNGVLITDNTGNLLVFEGWQEEPDSVTTPGAGADQRTPNNGSRMIFKIKLLDPLQGDIFTVSYTPILSTTKAIPKTPVELATVGGVQVVDLVGDLSARVGESQIVLMDRIGEDDINQNSRIFLSIILRQNTADASLSSIVEEYTLLAGCKDPTKFEEV